MLRAIAAICVGSMFLFPSVVYADDADYAQSGVYVGVNVAPVFELYHNDIDLPDSDLVPAVVVSSDDGFGFGATIGYRLQPQFAVEIQFAWIDDVDLDLDRFGTILRGDLDIFLVTANAKIYARTGRLQPYALIGGGFMTAELEAKDWLGPGLSVSPDDTERALQAGVGIECWATNKLALVLGGLYVMPVSDLDELAFWTLGFELKYRF